MPPALTTVPRTLDAFVKWESAQPERFELVGGVVRLMAGGTKGHDRISGNFFAALHAQLRHSSCSVHGSDLKVAAHQANAAMHAALLVRCGPRDDRLTSIDDPVVVVVEVLSESTARHDLTRKRLAYETIPSLRRIVYVAAEEAPIDMRVRAADGAWRDESVEGVATVITMDQITAEVSIAEVYEGSAAA